MRVQQLPGRKTQRHFNDALIQVSQNAKRDLTHTSTEADNQIQYFSSIVCKLTSKTSEVRQQWQRHTLVSLDIDIRRNHCLIILIMPLCASYPCHCCDWSLLWWFCRTCRLRYTLHSGPLWRRSRWCHCSRFSEAKRMFYYKTIRTVHYVHARIGKLRDYCVAVSSTE